MAAHPSAARARYVLNLLKTTPVEPLLEPGPLAVSEVQRRLDEDVIHRNYQTSFFKDPNNTHDCGPKSLEFLAAEQVAASIRLDIGNGVRVLKSCAAATQELVMQYLHYVPFKGIQEALSKTEGEVAESLDLDHWIIKNEMLMQQDVRKTEGLVTLDDDMGVVFPGSRIVLGEDGVGKYREVFRRQPPKTNFCFLDEGWKSTIKIQPSTDHYINAFNNLTKGVLGGLNWDNVFVAGGIALNAFLCIKGEDNDDLSPKPWEYGDMENDIDLYLYGFKTITEANNKIKEIWKVWNSNVSATNSTLIVRSSKTIGFIGNYPTRRIQIVLKWVASPTEVLLNFDLDPCAIGFNGKDVFMLPRCARALETGYSVFTTYLVEGHYFANRGQTNLSRAYKYADRGFGIRILPSYLASLHLNFGERGHHDQEILRLYSKSFWRNQGITPEGMPTEEDGGRGEEDERLSKEQAFIDSADSPQEKERRKIIRGMKVFKMIAHRSDLEAKDMINQLTARRSFVYGEEGSQPELVLNYGDLSLGRKGLGGAGLFLRHMIIWALEKQGKLRIAGDLSASTFYSSSGYTELPRYTWNKEFSILDFWQDIQVHNYKIHSVMMVGIGATPNDPPNRTSKRLVYSTDIEEVMKQDIVIPLVVPLEFESYVNNIFQETLRDRVPSVEDQKLLYPVLNSQQHTFDWQNWRFWVIDTENMWEKFDRRIDEVSEILWAMFNLNAGMSPWSDWSSGDPHVVADVLRNHFNQRASRTSEEEASMPTKGKRTFEWPDEAEKRLFKQWVMDTNRVKDFLSPVLRTADPSSLLETEEVMVDEEAFWDEEDNLQEGM